MAATPNLGLETLAEGQNQAEVIVNEDLQLLDAIVQLAVVDKDLTDPPSHSQGARYIVAGAGGAATGAWAGHELDVAASYDGTWLFFTPAPGWQAYVIDEATTYQYRPGSPPAWAASGEYTDSQALAAVQSILADTDDVAWDFSGGTFKAYTSRSLKVATEAGTTHAVVLEDNGVRTRCTHASGCELQIPTNATLALPIGFSALYVGVTGLLTLSHAGVTVNRPADTNETTRGAGGDLLLVKVATDEWDLRGDLDPV